MIDTTLTVAEKTDRLTRAGFTIGYATRADAELFGYLLPRDIETHATLAHGDAIPHVDLGRVARGDDSYDQTSTVLRSNYRVLHAEHDDTPWVDVSYVNVNSLGIFVEDLSDDMVDLLCDLSTDYPLLDENDHSELEQEGIEESAETLVRWDLTLPDGPEQELWDTLEIQERLELLWNTVLNEDLQPEHDGLDVHWPEPQLVAAIMARLQDRTVSN